MKLLLAREDVDPNLPDKNGRTPLSFAAEDGYEKIVKKLLERKDIDSDLPDRNGLTPLSYATRSNYFGTMRLLSNPRRSSCERSDNSDVAHETSVPAHGAQEQAGLASVSQRESTIPDPRHKITRAIPLVQVDEPPSNQPESGPSSSLPSGTPYWCTVLEPSRPLKRPADQTLLDPSKRQRFSSS